MKKSRPQIRWYAASGSNGDDFGWRSDVHQWNVLIVNEKNKIPVILNRIYSSLQPITEEITLSEGRVPESKLHYKLIHFESRGTKPDSLKWDEQIYRGRVVHDRELRDRGKMDGLSIYVEEHLLALSK